MLICGLLSCWLFRRNRLCSFQPERYWMNDTVGPLYVPQTGLYHLFCQCKMLHAKLAVDLMLTSFPGSPRQSVRVRRAGCATEWAKDADIPAQHRMGKHVLVCSCFERPRYLEASRRRYSSSTRSAVRQRWDLYRMHHPSRAVWRS